MSYESLRTHAEMFNDMQKARISAANKLRSGTIRPDATKLPDVLAQFELTEHQIGLAMRATLRKTVSPGILTWQKTEKGIGEHELARLLGIIGDPYVASPYHWEGSGENRSLFADPSFCRTVSQLWSYCGHGDPTRRRKKGMTAEEAIALGSPKAKTLVWGMADSCVKAGVRKMEGCNDEGGYDVDHREAISKYGQVYLDARRIYSTRYNDDGSLWSNGHQDAAAKRKVGKEILKDLWIAARDDHSFV